MVHTEEGWHTLPDGVKLYTKTWIVSSHSLPCPLSLFYSTIPLMFDLFLDTF